MYNYASSMNVCSALYFINIYVQGVYLKQGLYMLGDLTWLVS